MAGPAQTVTLAASAARTTSGNTADFDGFTQKVARVQLQVTAASGTTPTLDVVVEDSVDAGATWNTISTFTQATAATRQVVNITAPFTDRIRVRWTVGGTTPSFTFSVVAYAQ